MQKIGILGGMMDPIHLGHLHIAAAALDAGLDTVLLLPCKTPAHRAPPKVSFLDRVMMCRLACNDPRIQVSEVDGREGPCYAVDTLRLLQQQHPDATFTWILGADKLPSLPHWHNAALLFDTCSFFVCPRPGWNEMLHVLGASIIVLPATRFEASSSQAVALLRAGDDALTLLPRTVSRYIAEHGLYQPDYPSILRSYGMQESRLRHTLGVRKTAVHLADRYGVSMQKAAIAAMLHDLAKPLSLSQMQEQCRSYAPDLPNEVMADANFLHGPAAAILSEHILGIHDTEILSAIACHTVGKVGMSPLDMILFLADAIEPNRTAYPGLDVLRSLSQTDLRAAVRMSMQRTREYVLSQGHSFYSQTELAIQDLVDQ